ncbi:Glutamate receptor ionotropic [Acropora cervicornis]|uniref:Glutamate receptor ionotropic n=1 Tax=Acropora cervicornis TaxID=6130 RepID=A0AAD9Q2B7_ACRCE|nr:Glutamate receptor ionotropic [Acropora cervicornis]
MEKAQSICNIMILLVLLAKRINTLNKVVTCGLIGSHSELGSLTFAFNNAFFLRNVTVTVKHVNITEESDLFTEGSKLTVNLVQLSGQGQSTDGKEPVLQAMNEINSFQPDVILLYTENKNIGQFVQQKAFQLRSGFKWIIQGQVPINLNCSPRHVVLAMKIPHLHKLVPEKMKIEDRVKMNSSDTELDIALAYDAAQVIAHALKQCGSVNGSSTDSKKRDAMITCLREASLDGLTGPLHFSEDGARARIELDILNLRNNSFKKIGSWNSTKRSVHMSPNEAPFVMAVKEKDGSISYEGYCIDLLNKLAENLHFSYEIHTSPDEVYGTELPNGSWNGLIGELINQRADIAVADLTITERREKVVDFTMPYMFTTEDVILKKSSFEETVDLLQFMNPFHSEVWFAKLVTLLIVSVAVFILNHFSPFGYKDDNNPGTSQEFSFFNSVWFSLACMLQQGAENQPRNLSGRILTGCYWFCILIWISTYTANLAAFLTVKNAHQPISNLEDLAEPSYQLLLLNSSSTYEELKNSDLETHRRVWRRVKKDDIVSTTSLAIQKVREKKDFAFIHDGPVLQYAASQQPCDLTISLTTPKGLGLALQENDRHTNAFTLAILHLRESLFLTNLKRKWWETTDACPKEPNTKLSSKRIDLKSLLGVYVVLGAGLLLAFLTLIAEVLFKRKRKQKELKHLSRVDVFSLSFAVKDLASNFMTAKLNLLLLALANSYAKLIFPLLKLPHLISSSKLGISVFAKQAAKPSEAFIISGRHGISIPLMLPKPWSMHLLNLIWTPAHQ